MKHISICSLLFLSVNLFGNDSIGFKPVQGVFTTQVGLALANDFANINSLGLNGRYFFKEALAVRATLLFDNNKEVAHVDEYMGSGRGTYTTVLSSAGLMLGLEKHFNGTKRLSPYVGLEAGYMIYSIKEEGENSDGFGYEPDYKESSKRKANAIMAQAFLGFDYWITQGLYIGMEYTVLTYSAIHEKRSSKTMSSGGFTTTTFNPENKMAVMTTINALPVFRFGWMF